MRTYLGDVFVDAGLIWVGDPCYVLGDDASNRVTSWSDFCDKLFEGGTADRYSEPLGNGVGLAISSGYGDGSYPVYAEFEDGRVKRVEIEFF